jgi:hypothetical protein
MITEFLMKLYNFFKALMRYDLSDPISAMEVLESGIFLPV